MTDLKDWLFKKQFPAWGYFVVLLVMAVIFLLMVWTNSDILK